MVLHVPRSAAHCSLPGLISQELIAQAVVRPSSARLWVGGEEVKV
jgi:hypothetical protein